MTYVFGFGSTMLCDVVKKHQPMWLQQREIGRSKRIRLKQDSLNGWKQVFVRCVRVLVCSYVWHIHKNDTTYNLPSYHVNGPNLRWHFTCFIDGISSPSRTDISINRFEMIPVLWLKCWSYRIFWSLFFSCVRNESISFQSHVHTHLCSICERRKKPSVTLT